MDKQRVVLSAGGGAALGAAVSWIVNCALVEISLSTFFAFYFGILFFMIGGVILFRVHGSGTTDPAKRPLLYCFSSLVFLSGALCFLLDEHMFTFGWTLKVPLYLMLGISICFAFTFSAMDMVNWAVTVFQGAGARPLVETPVQVYLVLGTSVVLGAVFGFTFGLMDVEDARGVALRTRLAQVESVCLPIGAIAGAVAGALNELLGSRASSSYGRVGAREIYDDEDGI